MLALDGERTMIQHTVDRLRPLAQPDAFWVITNELLSGTICDQLDSVLPEQVICEPAARNTAPAVGLSAFLMERLAPESVLGIFPSDHIIVAETTFLGVIEQAIQLAASCENMVVLGVQPTRAETGYGYIETGETVAAGVQRVRRFTEKPNRVRAEEFVAAGNYCWNSGMFIWSARTLAGAVREHLPETAPLLEEIAMAYGTPAFNQIFRELYPKCENISVDYAILEPRSAKGEHHSNLYCLPADFGWNGLGSWSALYEHQVENNSHVDLHGNVTDCPSNIVIGARGNYVYTPTKFVALVGVRDLVVVETPDALLITSREHSQDVGKVVKELAARGRTDLI